MIEVRIFFRALELRYPAKLVGTANMQVKEISLNKSIYDFIKNNTPT